MAEDYKAPEKYSMSCHAVIVNSDHEILQLKATYGDFGWGLPGGCVEYGETVVETLHRECQEELGLNVNILGLTGVYFHRAYGSQVLIFRCELKPGSICLSHEHSQYKYFKLDELSAVQHRRVQDALDFESMIASRVF